MMKFQQHVVWDTQPVDNIVLINLGEGDRSYISRVINELRACQPKAIGVNILFQKYDPDKPSDTLLKEALSSPEVCVLTKHQGIGTYGVDKRFLESTAYGFHDMETGESGLKETYYLYRESNHKMNFSLAYSLAHLFDAAKAESYLKVQNEQPQLLRISALLEDFQIYDYKNLDFDCALLKDKIVIAGYLGPGDEDKFWTWARYMKDPTVHGEPDTYATELIANEVLMIIGNRSVN